MPSEAALKKIVSAGSGGRLMIQPGQPVWAVVFDEKMPAKKSKAMAICLNLCGGTLCIKDLNCVMEMVQVKQGLASYWAGS
jgi:hypothetical protein